MGFAEEVRKLLDDYLDCYAAGDAEGCARAYHPKGRIDSPFGPPVIGREALRDAHAVWFLAGEENKRMDILSANADGAVGYALLRYSADLPSPKAKPPEQEAGTSLNVLVRATEGWTILHTSLNADYDDDNG